MTIYLRTTVTSDPDLSGFDYYLQAGDEFDIDHYAEVHDLNRDEFDEVGVQAAITRAGSLSGEEWLKVEFNHE